MENAERSNIFIDVLHAVAKHRKFVLLTVVITTVLSIAVVLVLPRWYAASTVILPPQPSWLLPGMGEVSTLARQFSSLRGLAGVSGEGELYRYIAILQSRPTLERIVRGFNLFREYDIKNGSMEDAIDVLRGNVKFLVNEEGTLTIRVFDRDPRQAAAMADSFVTVLNELNIALNTRQALSNREFIEKRLDQNRAELRASEDSLKVFQQKHGVVIIPEKVASSVSGIAELYALKATKELQLAIMERSLGEGNVLLQTTKMELDELNRQLKNVPDLEVEYFRRYRDYAVQQKIFEMLAPLYEQAKIEEQRNTPTLLVLERASVPERPARPQRKVIVLVFVLLAVVVSISVAYAIERVESLKTSDPSKYAYMRQLSDDLKSIFRFRHRLS